MNALADKVHMSNKEYKCHTWHAQSLHDNMAILFNNQSSQEQ